MDARTRIFLKKTRWVWLGLAAAAVICLGIFLLLNWSLKDAQGPFEREAIPYTLEVPLSRNELNHLHIAAEDVRLEVAMANNIGAVQVSLFGPGYREQMVTVDVLDDRCDIRYDARPEDDPENLTLRVLIPQNALRTVQVAGNHLDMEMVKMRTDLLQVENTSGALQFDRVNANALQVATQQAPVRVENSLITQVDLEDASGDITLRKNDFRLVQTDTRDGNIFIYNDTWRGQWLLTTDTGSVTAVTKRLPYNLMIDAASEAGEVQMGYNTRYWKRAAVVQSDSESYIGSTGNNPANALTARSGTGAITVEKRGRYTDTDPFAPAEDT